MTPVSERRAHVPMQVEVEALQVTSLLQEVVQVKALLLVQVLFLVMMLEEVLLALSSLSLFTSPPTLTPTQTTMPQTRPGGA
jgi:hypothetical protein